ncbi:MAG: hypothetical protein JNK90_16900 [Planctomycetaceae bacterium]|nr:hypothetical protein [Planctomycetaceae bacterium]
MNLTWRPHWCPPFSSSRKIHHLAGCLALEQLFLRHYRIGTDPNLELPARFCSPALLLSRSGGGLPFSKISTTKFTSSRFLSLPGFKSVGIDFPSMENGDESHDEANYASNPGHLWSHKIRKFSMPMSYAVLNWASSQRAIRQQCSVVELRRCDIFER